MKMDNKNSEVLMKYLRILQTQIQDIGNTLHDFETEFLLKVYVQMTL